MKILFFGRGVINTQYAWALEKAGHIVEFYVRPGRKKQFGTHINLEILDTRRSKKERLIKEKWPIKMHEEINEKHDYDLIFVSVNPEQIESVTTYLAPRVNKATILFMSNTWHDICKLSNPIPLSQVIWGFPGGGGGIEGNNLYGGLYKTIHFGMFELQATERDLSVQKVFSNAGFKVAVHKDFQSWLRNHFISNVAMEVEVLKSGSFKNAAQSYESLVGLVLNTKEMIPILKVKGVKLDLITKVMAYVPPRVIGYLLKKFAFSPKSMPYTTIEHNQYQVGYSVEVIISEARKYGLKIPRLETVESIIKNR